MVLGSVAACSAAGGQDDDHGGGGGGAGGQGAAAGTGGGLVELDGGGRDAAPPPAVAHLKGKVVAPQGTIPIAGALVYLSSGAPESIPDKNYCQTCVRLPEGTPFTFSNPDGSFDLGVPDTGRFTLVVQKGQFRRYRGVDVVLGDQPVPQELTTLPRKTDAALGDTIPKLAVVQGQWDAIEVALAKFGLAQLQPAPFGLGVTVKPGTASFAIINDKQAFLSNPARLVQHNVVFLPCSGSDGTTCNDFVPGNGAVKAAVQNYVAAGGKLYVTDYSYEFVRQPFPGYVDWVGQSSALGSACQGGQYDARANVLDPGLKSWLSAQGVGDFDVKASWTIIDKVNPVATTDLEGNPTTVTPKVWVEGQVPSFGAKPTTISFERSCGRVLFSTYHTEAGQTTATAPMLPQELALLYVILEIGVCIEPPRPQ